MASGTLPTMRWKIDHHTISQLDVAGENLILPWGIETADSSAFYSLDPAVGYRYQIEQESYLHDQQHNSAEVRVKMKDGRFSLKTNDQLMDQRTVRRTAKLTAIDPTLLMDFVVRYRFQKKHFSVAEINGQRFSHTRSNIYHQFQTHHVTLHGPQHTAVITLHDARTPASFSPVMYVRDATNEWVVHVRLLPAQWDTEVIKLCNFWYRTRSVPQFVSRPILRSTLAKRALWYRGERAPYRNKLVKLINPIAYPLGRLESGESLFLDTGCEITVTNDKRNT